MRLLLILLTLSASAPLAAHSQEDGTEGSHAHTVTARTEIGKILQTNDFLRGDNAHKTSMRHFKSAQLSLGWQTLGDKEWERVHRLPSFGLGVGTAWFDNKPEIGQPISVFGFYNGVFARIGNSAFRYNIEMGLALHWNCYDAKHNPYNITIGSKATVHLGLGVEYAYTVADKFTASIGAGVTHFSNGAIRKPNKGLNLFGGQVKLAYRLGGEKLPTARPPATKPKGNEVDISIGYGLKRFECDTVACSGLRSQFDKNARYTALTLQSTFLHRYCHKGKYGGGLTLLYDDHMGSRLICTPEGRAKVRHGDASHRFALGLMAAHEFCIARLGIVTQIGYYLIRPTGIAKDQQKEPLFQRAGLKYTFPCNIHAGINIYAHRLSIADFIEWNVGYSLNFRRRQQS